MNERYLFRGQDLAGTWHEGFLVGEREIKILFYPDDIKIVEPETIGQCTGIRDKNGKLIFEGDVFRYSDGCTYYFSWNSDMAGFEEVLVEETYECAPFIEHTEPEIIGNIHGNPELLEVEVKP